MNEKDRERLSALMDGEAGEHELRQVIKALETDGSLVDTWKRYHLAQSALRRESGAWAGVDLRASLSARLDDEAVRRPALLPRRGMQALASVAVAASVAMVTVFGWQSLQPAGVPQAGNDGRPVASSAQVQTVALGPLVVVREDGEELVLPAGEAAAPTAGQDRLNAYLARHARAAGSLASGRAVATYARVVSVEGEAQGN